VPDDASIASYLDRLGVDRQPPSAVGLFTLHRAQVERVPYETTWIHLGERWDVDQEASLRRIAHQRRGGYCFHLNGAFALLLRNLGYDVTLHRGGVHGPEGISADGIDNHLVLLVRNLPSEHNPDGAWYVDTGLGDALYQPLPLRAGEFRQGPFTFGFAQGDSEIADWQFRHDPVGSFGGMAFESRPATMDEFAARNTVLSTSPESGFVKLLTVQRRDSEGVDALRGLVLRRVGGDDRPELTLSTPSDWFDVLREVFDLPLDDVSPDDRRRLWERVSATHRAWQDRES
jgi:N-hydroxyarylamine O-acetyltransferase